MRQIGKQILTLTKPYVILFSVWIGALSCVPAFAQEKAIVTNVLTGVAISGYDPVAYFTDGEARMGSPEYEYGWRGVSWYFVSQANQDVFANDPDVYAPLFGGHGAMAMSRGHLSDGNPLIFRIVDEKLLLFYSQGNREAFDLGGEVVLARAMSNWDALPDRRRIFTAPDTQAVRATP
jgi:YHS domain-containing protein